MILCEKCGKNKATFFYQENKNGIKKEIHLCSHCAGEAHLTSEDFFTPFSLFSPFVGRDLQAEKKCPRCGMTLSAIQKKGKFGCSECYDTFSKELDLTPFIGKGYEGELKTEKTKKEEQKPSAALSPLDSLKAQLKKALEEEEYEKAATLRDEIRREEGKA